MTEKGAEEQVLAMERLRNNRQGREARSLSLTAVFGFATCAAADTPIETS